MDLVTLGADGDEAEDDERLHEDNEWMKLLGVVREIHEISTQDLSLKGNWNLSYSILYLILSTLMVIVELQLKQAVCL